MRRHSKADGDGEQCVYDNTEVSEDETSDAQIEVAEDEIDNDCLPIHSAAVWDRYHGIDIEDGDVVESMIASTFSG